MRMWLVAMGLAVSMVAGCAPVDNAAARRASAEAEKIRAESAAEAERAAAREMQRDAAHQRSLETLPYLVLVVGLVGLAGLVGVMVWDGRGRQRDNTGQAVVAYLAELRAEQSRREAEVWRAIAHLERERRALPERRRGEVVIHPDQTWL
jgi:hypothetical protein